MVYIRKREEEKDADCGIEAGGTKMVCAIGGSGRQTKDSQKIRSQSQSV